MSLRARIRDGDPSAFEELFDAYAGSVYGYAFRHCADRTEAEDITSMTFLEVWRLRGRIDPDGGSLRPWLLGIAVNVARNTRRAARRYQDALARMPREDRVPDFADDVAGRIDDAERIAAVRRAYAALRRPEQEVLALVLWSGLDYAETAEALGVPVGTVKSRLSRARGKLEKLAAHREPAAPSRQERGDRDTAVRSAKEACR
ncbi:RNA polymerase sigma factor [Rhizohabitans arisaemae]|uniref:RNA polymerase sigma factor n=1 Tax=Rhizohabitans arisaemae TaxID=2720610 RepID=UPI0024B18C21|nr:sigma-70 family RNA polymerase sigma factor [Rhizohabitans arisaemae]